MQTVMTTKLIFHIPTISSSLSEPAGAASTACLIPEIQSSLVDGFMISMSYFSGSSKDGLNLLADGDDITTKDLVPPPGFSLARILRTRTVLGY